MANELTKPINTPKQVKLNKKINDKIKFDANIYNLLKEDLIEFQEITEPKNIDWVPFYGFVNISLKLNKSFKKLNSGIVQENFRTNLLLWILISLTIALVIMLLFPIVYRMLAQMTYRNTYMQCQEIATRLTSSGKI